MQKYFSKLDRWTIVHLLILAMALVLEVMMLFKNGYNNTYYAAGVKSMGQSWHNFFFASYDPGGFVSIDKTPVALWIQVCFVKLFGFHGWALILPQVIAHLISIELLYRLVSKTSGQKAALLSATIFSLTPISFVIAATNQPDSILILFLLLSAWALFRSLESNKFKYLILSFIFVGISFNTKGIQAFITLPALVLTYLIGANAFWQKKLGSLAILAGILAIISFSWILIVDSIPADQRPYVGSTQNNSEMTLAFGYNGTSRLFGDKSSPLTSLLSKLLVGTASVTDSNKLASEKNYKNKVFAGIGAPAFGEKAGSFRLWNKALGGQASWFLLLAIFGAISIFIKKKMHFPIAGEQLSGIFWISWLIPGAVIISLMPFMHPYYTATIAPPIAALSGTGFILLIEYYKTNNWKKWLLPLSLLFSTFNYWLILSNFPDFFALKITISLLSLAIIVLLSLKNLFSITYTNHILHLAALSALIIMLSVPVIWISHSISAGVNAIIPQAGPSEIQNAGKQNLSFDPRLLSLLTSKENKSKFVVATESSVVADKIIIKTGLPVMNLGGFYGTDPTLSLEELKKKLEAGIVRYFLIGDTWKQGDYNFDKAEFIIKNCYLVDSTINSGLALYDCKNINK